LLITLQFSTQPGWQSAFIRFATWSDWSHVDVLLEDGTLLGSRMDGGVKIRPANYANFSKKALYQIDAPAEVMDFAKKQVGLPYDSTGIINFGAHRDWRQPDSYFCSELIAAAFEAGNLPLLNPDTPSSRISPRDLTLSPLLKKLA
jgi:uncharacterized protein YycO